MKNILKFEKWYTKLGGKIPINEKLNPFQHRLTISVW